MATNTEELQALVTLDTEHDLKKVPETTPLQTNLEEEIQAKLKALSDTEENKFKKMTITKEIFEQIRKSLEETVKSMEKNPSLFSRAADFWGELPLWQKILGGVALTLPTLIIGIAANVGFLLAICGVTAITYTAGGLILDDHHKCSTSAVESLQKGILGLADLLELTINALNVIREQLEIEISKFAQENQRLSENINLLSHQIDAVDKQVRATSKINETLTITKEGLQNVANTLTEGVNQQTDLLQQAQEKLHHINDAYGSSQKELAEKVLEIEKVRTELGEDLNKAKLMIEALGAAISEFSSTIGNEEKQRVFQEKLDDFLKNKEASFLQIAERICEAEKKLILVQKELESTNASYRELLERQGKQVDRLEGLDFKGLSKKLSKAPSSKETFIGESLSRNGLYATSKKENGPTETHESQLTQTLQHS
ncbi:inclusion membrane protein A [Legionella sainthelensi]|uniref:Inclusion membrane protein A n=1 Tax=Legionella sainthelensi TaxID=28087 RepID=A0A0W0YFV8_9GAMM|nr:LegC2/C7 family Dot/Icm T4SS effector [Legionella sainthelensi]KTD55494.1 inclusion membrane protein A [Legionella sainthelensi]VEH37493.1 inclusion membrane protein A [Legionella sainthelensi]